MEKKTFDVLLDESKTDAFFKTFGFFKDKYGSLGIAYIQEDLRRFVSIKTYNEEGEPTGFMNIFIHPNRLYLSEIYCYKKYRGIGIADALIDLSDFTLKDYAVNILRGVLMPHDILDDDTAPSQDMMVRRARVEAFYKKSGFDIVRRENYLADTSKYPQVDYALDFLYYEEIPETIIIRQVQKSSPYVEVNGLVFAVNALERLEDIQNFLSIKKFNMTPALDISDKC
ncbi:MAG TPA: hypothetical protein DCY94_01630 [Firmicutes bacterium]|nr:hypothetical protein [Bacillota bacterium]